MNIIEIWCDMKLVFLTNLVNHHQIHVADELYRILKGDYVYVAFEPLPDFLIRGGYPNIQRSYILNAYEDERNYAKAVQLTNEADVVIIGSAPEYLVHKRLSENKLTFHYSERWFKTKLGVRILSPRFWYNLFLNHWRFNRKKSYMLCASAYTAYDVNMVHTYKNKCYKWGYFTAVADIDIDRLFSFKDNNAIQIMWCARFLKWKHPELALLLAKKLKTKSYNFIINMFGSGEELVQMRNLAKQLDVEDVVAFRGNLPNYLIQEEMRKHHIFLFTSDRNEGWGAVLNEAMANACSVVASNEIGSVPYLINNGVNGLIFKSLDIDSLTAKVELLINNPTLRDQIAREAYITMRDIWSPRNAAESLMELINNLESGISFNHSGNGPCSIAEIIKG